MTYTVNVTRTGGFWHVEVVEINRVTQARTLHEVEVMTRDLIDIMTGDTAPELDVRVQLPVEAREHLAAVERLREAETQARADAARELRAAAVALKDEGISMRDMGSVLGVSHQRASQLSRC